MNTLYIGYINGTPHHWYVKDAHGECHGLNATTATCLARELIKAGHTLHTIHVGEGKELDYIEF